jgi:hypothetical protein
MMRDGRQPTRGTGRFLAPIIIEGQWSEPGFDIVVPMASSPRRYNDPTPQT